MTRNYVNVVIYLALGFISIVVVNEERRQCVVCLKHKLLTIAVQEKTSLGD